MISRTTSFGIGLILISLAGFAVLAGDDERQLCVNGHPAPRRPNVTYGGKPAMHGLVRDHKVPLGLGGPDTADNVQYQTPADSEAKNHVEWSAIESFCRGDVSLEDARARVKGWQR